MPSAGRFVIDPKKAGETVLVSPNFISALQASETISTAVCTATVFSGTDTNPGAIISGSASFTDPGTVVTQLVTGGVLGCVYEFLCTITTSLGQTLEMSGYLAIVPDLP
jgi:hypothetical protein